MSGSKFTIDDTNLSLLGEAIDQSDWEGGYLDPETGMVYLSHHGEVFGDDGETVDWDEVDWVMIPGEGSRDPFNDMWNFSLEVADPVLGAQLENALDGRKPFRRFRDVMYYAPEQIRSAWNSYRQAKSEIRALEWLIGREFGDPETNQRLLTEREQMAADAVAVVTQTRPRVSSPALILINGMSGTGKTALASAFAAQRSGTLNLDIGLIQTLISGEPATTIEPVYTLALAMADAHIRSGYDVVVPQLVAHLGQLHQFEAAVGDAGGSFLHVVLEVDDADNSYDDQQALTGREDLREILSERPTILRLPANQDTTSVTRLIGLLEES